MKFKLLDVAYRVKIRIITNRHFYQTINSAEKGGINELNPVKATIIAILAFHLIYFELNSTDETVNSRFLSERVFLYQVKQEFIEKQSGSGACYSSLDRRLGGSLLGNGR